MDRINYDKERKEKKKKKSLKAHRISDYNIIGKISTR